MLRLSIVSCLVACCLVSVGLAQQSKEHQLLKEKLAERDALQREIDQLRKSTNTWQQVVVRLSMMELSLSKLRELEFQYEGLDSQELVESGIGAILSSGLLDSPEDLKRRSTDAKMPKNGTVAFGTFREGNAIEGLLDALQQSKALTVIADPTIATISGRPASFNVGGEFPVPTASSSGGFVEFRKFGTQVDLLPVVLGNEKLRIEIRPRVSEVDEQRLIEFEGRQIPGLRVREMSTAFEIYNGQTAVFAGLIQNRAKDARLSVENSGTAAEGLTNETERLELIIVVRPELVSIMQDDNVISIASTSERGN